MGRGVRLIDVARAMQRYDGIGPRLEAEFLRHAGAFDRWPQQLVRIEHNVADQRDALLRDTLGQEVLVTVVGWRPQHVGDRIGDDPVDLLGHGPVAAAQPRLDVADRDQQLLRRERAGDGRIDIAEDDRHVGALGQAQLLVGDHDTGGLLGVTAAADPEMVMRLRQAQIGEKRVGHVDVVVLAGMDQDRLAPRLSEHGVIKRRHLHEVGAGGGYEMGFDHGCVLAMAG